MTSLIIAPLSNDTQTHQKIILRSTFTLNPFTSEDTNSNECPFLWYEQPGYPNYHVPISCTWINLEDWQIVNFFCQFSFLHQTTVSYLATFLSQALSSKSHLLSTAYMAGSFFMFAIQIIQYTSSNLWCYTLTGNCINCDFLPTHSHSISSEHLLSAINLENYTADPYK